MRKINTQILEDKIYEMALHAGVNLTPSCIDAMEKAYADESGKACSFALKTIIGNSEIAKEKAMPVCQDTGLSVVILEIGQQVYLEGKALSEAKTRGARGE